MLLDLHPIVFPLGVEPEYSPHRIAQETRLRRVAGELDSRWRVRARSEASLEGAFGVRARVGAETLYGDRTRRGRLRSSVAVSFGCRAGPRLRVGAVVQASFAAGHDEVSVLALLLGIPTDHEADLLVL